MVRARDRRRLAMDSRSSRAARDSLPSSSKAASLFRKECHMLDRLPGVVNPPGVVAATRRSSRKRFCKASEPISMMRARIV